MVLSTSSEEPYHRLDSGYEVKWRRHGDPLIDVFHHDPNAGYPPFNLGIFLREQSINFSVR